MRQKREHQAIGDSFARAHRNHLGFGLDLRSAAGAEVFAELVASADAVFANFKPGTLAALGFDYERLRAVNPAIVLAESSAYGDEGPWSTRMGYGPLVRAATGVTSLWACDQANPAARHPFYDATTIFPDHVVGRITAIGALAALIRRKRCGIGARVHVLRPKPVSTSWIPGSSCSLPRLMDPETPMSPTPRPSTSSWPAPGTTNGAWCR